LTVPVVVTDPPLGKGVGTGVDTGIGEGVAVGEAEGEGLGEGAAVGEGVGEALGAGVAVGEALGEGDAVGVGVGVGEGVIPLEDPKSETAAVPIVAGVAVIAVPPVAVVTATELVSMRSQTIRPSLAFTLTVFPRIWVPRRWTE